MMREWVTVVTWQHGVAQVRCEEPRASCGDCNIKQSCSARILNKFVPMQYHLEVISVLPLVPGQRIEVGITESSLLRSALLVYMLPLLGLIGGAAIMQSALGTDLAAVCGSMVGGIVSFFCAQYLVRDTHEIHKKQLVILQVTRPPLSLHISG